MFVFYILLFSKSFSASDEDIYNKIDLFGEVLDKVNKEYVDEINQSDVMDSAINGVLQSLDPYSAYMSPEMFDAMQTETSGEFGGLGIEVGMEAGVVKVISPIDGSPASKVGVKAGDYIVKINDVQVQGKSLMEAVDLKIKDELKKRTNSAYKKGIFGAPSFIVNNKIFWGQDRLEFVLNEANK